MEKDSAMMQNINYKLLDLMKFICAFLVIGIHTRPLQAVSDVADKLFYYDISNYAVPFFYACTGYFLIVRQQNKGVHEKICFRSFQIFPRLRFRLRFCIAPVFYAMYIRQKADIFALKYRSASVRHRPFCAVSVPRPPATGQAFVASADRIVRCAHIRSVSAFIFRTALYFL